MASSSVLIVEDEEGIQTLLRLSLEMHGHSVVAARNGKEALEKLAEIPTPGLILLDLMMPVMNGRDFAAVVEKHPVWSKIPIALMSAFSERAPTMKNIVAVIDKPIDLAFLLELAKKSCG